MFFTPHNGLTQNQTFLLWCLTLTTAQQKADLLAWSFPDIVTTHDSTSPVAVKEEEEEEEEEDRTSVADSIPLRHSEVSHNSPAVLVSRRHNAKQSRTPAVLTSSAALYIDKAEPISRSLDVINSGSR